MSLNFNFDFNFKDVTLDKLYKDANSNVKLDLSPKAKDIELNSSTSKINSYGGISTSTTETLDLSSSILDTTDNNVNNNTSLNVNSNNVGSSTTQNNYSKNINPTSFDSSNDVSNNNSNNTINNTTNNNINTNQNGGNTPSAQNTSNVGTTSMNTPNTNINNNSTGGNNMSDTGVVSSGSNMDMDQINISVENNARNQNQAIDTENIIYTDSAVTIETDIPSAYDAGNYYESGLIDINTYKVIINTWVDTCQSTLEEKKEELNALESDFDNFINNPSNYEGTGLLMYPNQFGFCQTPDEIRNDANVIYTIMDARNVDYEEAREIHSKYVDEEYIPLFNKYLNEAMGMTYEEYLQKKSELENSISELSGAYYSLRQEQKVLPYLELSESTEYQSWLANRESNIPEITMERDSFWGDKIFVNGVQTDPKNVDPMLLGYAIDKGYITHNSVHSGMSNLVELSDYYYLTQDQRNMYSYLYETQGSARAEEYKTAIEDSINQAKAMEEVNDILEKCTIDGKINYDTLTLLFWEGVESGVISFGEGLINIFNDEGMISTNDYKSMFLLSALTNTRNAYINEITTDIYNSKGNEAAETFYKNIYNQETGEINLNYAKKHLTDEQYKKLEVRIAADDSFVTQLYTGGYELGMAGGNMLPSMVLAYLTKGASLSLGASPQVAATIASVVGNVTMGLSSAGNAYNQALIQGNRKGLSRLYGMLSGLSETTLGMLLGNIPGLNTNASFSLKGILSEGIEEGLQTYVDAALTKVVLGEPVNLNDCHGEALKGALYGMILSGVTTGVKTTYTVAVGSQYANLSYSNLLEFYKLLNTSNMAIQTDNNGNATFVIEGNEAVPQETIDKINSIFPGMEVVQKFNDGTTSKPISEQEVWDMQRSILFSDSSYIDSLINDSNSGIFHVLADSHIKTAIDKGYTINKESPKAIRSNPSVIEYAINNTSVKEKIQNIMEGIELSAKDLKKILPLVEAKLTMDTTSIRDGAQTTVTAEKTITLDTILPSLVSGENGKVLTMNKIIEILKTETTGIELDEISSVEKSYNEGDMDTVVSYFIQKFNIDYKTLLDYCRENEVLLDCSTELEEQFLLTFIKMTAPTRGSNKISSLDDMFLVRKTDFPPENDKIISTYKIDDAENDTTVPYYIDGERYDITAKQPVGHYTIHFALNQEVLPHKDAMEGWSRSKMIILQPLTENLYESAVKLEALDTFYGGEVSLENYIVICDGVETARDILNKNSEALPIVVSPEKVNVFGNKILRSMHVPMPYVDYQGQSLDSKVPLENYYESNFAENHPKLIDPKFARGLATGHTMHMFSDSVSATCFEINAIDKLIQPLSEFGSFDTAMKLVKHNLYISGSKSSIVNSFLAKEFGYLHEEFMPPKYAEYGKFLDYIIKNEITDPQLIFEKMCEGIEINDSNSSHLKLIKQYIIELVNEYKLNTTTEEYNKLLSNLLIIDRVMRTDIMKLPVYNKHWFNVPLEWCDLSGVETKIKNILDSSLDENSSLVEINRKTSSEIEKNYLNISRFDLSLEAAKLTIDGLISRATKLLGDSKFDNEIIENLIKMSLERVEGIDKTKIVSESDKDAIIELIKWVNIAELQNATNNQGKINSTTSETDSSQIAKVELQNRIKAANDAFNLTDFYNGKTSSTGAVLVITPNQTIMASADFTGVDEQGYAVEEIYKGLYDGYSVDRFGIWQVQALQKGNIIIQLCRGISSIVWTPDTITTSQYEALKVFNEQVKSIANQISDPIEFESGSDDIQTINGIDTILNGLTSRINDNMTEQRENILGIENELTKKITNHDTNSTLNNIITTLGDKMGRQALISFMVNRDLKYIPEEYRSQIENISNSEIKRFLNPDKSNIGTQFFGEQSDGLNRNVSLEKIARIKKKNDMFSLEEFYGAADGDAAIIFMTENQVVNLKCGMHETGLRDAISGIYDISLTNKKELGSENEILSELLKKNNIYMRLVSGNDLCLMLPDKISRMQYEMFKSYVNKYGETLKEISRSIDPTGEGVLYFWNNSLGNQVITHDLQDAVKYAETLIDDSIKLPSEKNVIGYTIDDMKVVDNSTLTNIITNLGDRKGRQALISFMINRDLKYIPEEYRNQIQSIPNSEIRSFLNPDKSNIGTQFFGGRKNIMTTLEEISSIINNGQQLTDGDIIKIKEYEQHSDIELTNLINSNTYANVQKKNFAIALYLKSLNLSLNYDNQDTVVYTLLYRLFDKNITNTEKNIIYNIIDYILSKEKYWFNDVRKYNYQTSTPKEITTVKDKHLNFDILEYYNSNGISGKDHGAVIYITENQVVNMLNGGKNGERGHESARKQISSAIYDVKVDYNSISSITKEPHASSLLSYIVQNNITLRLISEYGVRAFMIEFPEKISRKQYELFKAYAEKYNSILKDISINESSKNLYKEGLIIFDDVISHDLEAAVKYAETLIDDSVKILEEKHIIGYTLDDLRTTKSNVETIVTPQTTYSEELINDLMSSIYNPQELIKVLEKNNILDIDAINKLLNEPRIREYILNLSIEDFHKIMLSFNTLELSILECTVFKEKILNMNDEEIIKIIPLIYGELHEICSLMVQTETTEFTIKNGKIINLDTDSFYNIKIEIDGEIIEKKLNTGYSDYLRINNIVDITEPSFIRKIITGDFKILLSVQKDNIASTLYLTKKDGLNEGLNKIKLLINGIEQTILLISYNGSPKNIMNKFENVTSAKILSIESVASHNITVQNEKALYEINYSEYGERKKFYLVPYRHILAIDEYLVDNNITDATDVEVKLVEPSEIDFSSLSIGQYSAAKDIFSRTKYGGNQGDVAKLVSYYILFGKNMNKTYQDIMRMLNKRNFGYSSGTKIIDKIYESFMGIVYKDNADVCFNKGELLCKIIKNYFPKITKQQIINLSKAYEGDGCGYMAIANTFCTYMGSIKNGEQLFRERFGFDLYIEENGIKYYNLEAVALDIFCSKVKNKTIDEIISSKSNGLTTFEYKFLIQNYFLHKNIEVKTTNIDIDVSNTKNKLLESILQTTKTQFRLLSAANFDLQLIGNSNSGEYHNSDGALVNSYFDGYIERDVGNHTMFITDIDENGDIIVSSWGEKFKFISESIKEHINKGQDSCVFLHVMEFDIKE